MLLTGTFRRTIDQKERISIPKPLRELMLGTEGSGQFVAPGMDGCLSVMPEETFRALSRRLAERSPAAREVRDYSRLFFSRAHRVVPDSQARLRLPSELVQWAGLEGEVAIVGAGDRLEIWAGQRWDRYVAQRAEKFDELAELALESRIPPRTDPKS